MAEIDRKSELRTTTNKGFTEGRAEERAEIASAMKAKGMDAGLIAELTGLTAEQIEQL